ncbi:MAG: hypothetical protein AAF630_16875 [Cyanobacteria bacterium P01_C01_bin.38]
MGRTIITRYYASFSVINYQLPITNYQLPITNYQCPMPNAQCPIPNPQSPIPNPQFPFSNLKSNTLLSTHKYRLFCERSSKIVRRVRARDTMQSGKNY